jgi:hypothetical protein
VVWDGDYEGTIQSEIRVTVSGVDQADHVNLEEYGERLDDFRRAFEATDAFKALTSVPRYTSPGTRLVSPRRANRTREIVSFLDACASIPRELSVHSDLDAEVAARQGRRPAAISPAR